MGIKLFFDKDNNKSKKEVTNMKDNSLMTMVNSMNTQELAQLANVVTNNRLSKVESSVYELAQQIGTIQANFNILNNKVEEVKDGLNFEADRNSKQDILLDTLEYKDNGYLKKQLSRACRNRVAELFNGFEETPEYALFYPYVRRNIGCRVAEYFKAGRMGQIKSEDFDNAIAVANTYYPTDAYLQRSFDKLAFRVKTGMLSSNRIYSFIAYTNPNYIPQLFTKFEATENE